MKSLHKSGTIKHVLENLKPHVKGDFKHKKETKEILSKARKNKTYEEIFGKNKAKELKNNLSKKTSKENNPFYKKIVVELIKHLIDNGGKVKDIAIHFNVSRQTILNKFKENYGITIKKHKDSVRNRN